MQQTENNVLAHHFETLEQQHESNTLGMWAFLATEILFFGGVFTVYAIYRYRFGEAFVAGSEHLSVTLGTINTIVLIGSSLTMALAIYAAQSNQKPTLWIGATIVLGGVFVGIKAYEWIYDYNIGLVPGLNWNSERWTAEGINSDHVQLFFFLYFVMTGLHALHMLVGFAILGVVMYYGHKDRYTSEFYTPLEVTGLYWHFVDIVWIFLFPLLYLIRH